MAFKESFIESAPNIFYRGRLRGAVFIPNAQGSDRRITEQHVFTCFFCLEMLRAVLRLNYVTG